MNDSLFFCAACLPTTEARSKRVQNAQNTFNSLNDAFVGVFVVCNQAHLPNDCKGFRVVVVRLISVNENTTALVARFRVHLDQNNP